jgi:hypothetical protein
MADLIDRTAQQVRTADGIHGLYAASTQATGRKYRTWCARWFSARKGAVLTNDPASCQDCTRRAEK